MRFPTVVAFIALACALVYPRMAGAQVEAPRPIEEVERDTRKPRAKPKPAAVEEPADLAEEDSASLDEPDPETEETETAEEDRLPSRGAIVPARGTDEGQVTPARIDPPVLSPDKPTTFTLGERFGPPPPPPPPGHSPDRPLPKPIVTSKASDDDLLAAWARWRKSTTELDLKGAEDARVELLRLKEELGIQDLDSFASGFIRHARAKAKANDAAGAVTAAQTAVELAPDLPYAHAALAEMYFAADPTDVGRAFGEAKVALKALWQDPRYLRPALADLGTGALVALSATAIVAIVALFLRRARYFLHDFHHLFPKAAARWQSGAMAGLLLVIPVVLHLGLVPVLVLPLAAVALYLSLGERIVAAALVALLGVVPVLGGLLAENTSFAGTVAEDVYRLERGGIAASGAAQRVLKRHADNKAEFPELFALARFELRRGQLDAAVDHFKLAATKQNNEARLLTNLGNALLTRGDTDGALELYTSATQADGTLAAPYYNLSKLLSRRAAALPDEAVGLELDKAHNAMITATSLDNALFSRDDRVPATETLSNRLLLSPALRPSEIAELASSEESGRKVQAQLSRVLLGAAGSTVAFIYPLVLAGLVVALGQAAFMLGAARACEKCGRSVCRRCDKDLGVGSALCGQCVNVYARKGVVPAPLKVRKQLEVDRYRAREGRLSYVLGLLCSGAGHLFSGLPVRGAVYVFLFAFTIFHAVFRQGVVRSPFGSMPLTWRLVPVGLLLLSVYLLSLRGLYKRQTE